MYAWMFLSYIGKVDDPRSFAQGIIRVLSTDIQNVDPERLAVHIYQRGLTSYNQFELLTSRILTKQQKSVELLKLLNQAATAFNPVKNINELYLALLDSCEEDVGLGGHHEIARSLRLQGMTTVDVLLSKVPHIGCRGNTSQFLDYSSFKQEHSFIPIVSSLDVP